MSGITATGTCHPIRVDTVSTSPAIPALAKKYGNDSWMMPRQVCSALTASDREMTIATGTLLTRKNTTPAAASRSGAPETADDSHVDSKTSLVAATASAMLLKLKTA